MTPEEAKAIYEESMKDTNPYENTPAKVELVCQAMTVLGFLNMEMRDGEPHYSLTEAGKEEFKAK